MRSRLRAVTDNSSFQVVGVGMQVIQQLARFTNSQNYLEPDPHLASNKYLGMNTRSWPRELGEDLDGMRLTVCYLRLRPIVRDEEKGE
jgi:hypothetical protein